MAGIDKHTKLYSNFNLELIDNWLGNTYTAYNSAEISTSQSKFGGASLYIPSSSAYVEVDQTSGFDLGTSEFTFDFFIRFDSLPSTGNSIIILSRYELDGSDYKGWELSLTNDSGDLKFVFKTTVVGDTTVRTYTGSAVTLAVDTWYYLALNRPKHQISSSWYVARIQVILDTTRVLNGNLQSYTNIDTASEKITIGNRSSGGEDGFSGYIDNLRITIDTSRYDDDLTTYPVTVPTSSFTCDSVEGFDEYTKFYADFDADMTPTYEGVTTDRENNGYVVYHRNYKYGTRSMYFSSSTSSAHKGLRLIYTDELQFNDDDFTVELWVNFISLPSSSSSYPEPFFDQLGSTKSARFFSQYDSGNYGVGIKYSTDGTNIAGTLVWNYALTTGTWYHIAFTRDGADIDVHINGVSQGSKNIGTASIYPASSSTAFRMGRLSSLVLQSLHAYVDEPRISIGVARYPVDDDFTPPQGEFIDEIPSTYQLGKIVMYCKFDSSIIDDTGNKSFVLTNNPTILSTSKIGSGSLHLDRTSTDQDYVTVYNSAADSDFDLASHDFTFDFFVNFDSLPFLYQTFTFFKKGEDESPDYTLDYHFKYVNDSGTRKLVFTYTTDGSTDIDIVVTQSFTTGTWYHLAVQRDSDDITIYVDGVDQGQTTVTSTIYNNTGTDDDFSIGGSVYKVDGFDGYIDNFRFVKGEAMYTTGEDFTPPTEEYTLPTAPYKLKYHDGSDWVAAPLKYHDGSDWTIGTVKYYDTSWV